MFGVLFQPLHLILSRYAMFLGITFLAGFFLGRYVEKKSLKSYDPPNS